MSGLVCMHRERGGDVGGFTDVCEEKLLHVANECVMAMVEGDWVEGVAVYWRFLGLWDENSGNMIGGAVYELEN